MQLFDATAMANAVSNDEVTAEQLVAEAFERIETLNPAINAVVHTRKEEALQEARMRDFKGLPFGGVPILLKDLGQKQAGEVSTAGSKLFLKARATQSDYFVKRLEEAGFIILGRTNVPEFGFKNITDPTVFGATNLPFDFMRNAGGSSGGAAASVSSGIVSIATASDGGGSIRIPASFNGLIGLKPSRGRVVAGPHMYRSWQGAAVQFALTKSVRDTRNVLRVLQTEQRENPFSLPVLTEKELSRTVDEPLRIAVTTKSPIGSWVSEYAIEAVTQTVEFLQAQGHNVQVVEWPFDGVELMKSYYMMYSVETATMFDRIEASLGRTMTIDDMELMTWAIYRSGQHIPAKLYTQVLQYWDTVAETMEQFHRTYDLFLCPTTADVAPYHQDGALNSHLIPTLQQMDELTIAEQQSVIWRMYEKSLALTPFTQFANLTGQPALSLPVYQTDNGLPLGVQFVAAKGREDVLLSIAQQFECAEQLKIK